MTFNDHHGLKMVSKSGYCMTYFVCLNFGLFCCSFPLKVMQVNPHILSLFFNF